MSEATDPLPEEVAAELAELRALLDADNPNKALDLSDPEKLHLNKFYDQIAWFTGRHGSPALSLKYLRGGFFDFNKAGLKSRAG